MRLPVQYLVVPALVFASQTVSAGGSIADMDIGKVDDFLKSQKLAAGYTLPKRIVEISGMFLGVPFKESPLGEGTGSLPDEDPLWAFDAVDCQTFIEESLALSLSKTFEEFIGHLMEIRYMDGAPSFHSRNHLPEVQWLRNNIRKGYLRDITVEVGGSLAEYLSREVKDPRIGTVLKADIESGNGMNNSVFLLYYIPAVKALKILSEIPEGTIMSVVRVVNPRKPYVITHMGIVFVGKNGRRYLRHASRHFGGRVSDMPLDVYLHTFDSYKNWPALGINLMMPQRP